MKYKIGDRVIVIQSDRYRNEQRIGKIGIINRESRSYVGVYHVQFLNKNPKWNRCEETAYLCEDEIELDKEFYRDSKLKAIGI